MNKLKTTLLGASCALGLATAQAHAADFSVLGSGPDGIGLGMSGEIVPGDALRFQALLATLPPNKPKMLFMQSPGGNVLESISLGLAIHNAKVATVVGDYCASGCALAWLGGVTRAASPHAQIGFHTPYVLNGAVQSVSSVGAAEVGYYTAVLGLSPDAAAYVTTADPSSAQWLTPADAQQLKLNVVYLPDQAPAAQPVAAPAAPTYTPPPAFQYSLRAPYAAPAPAPQPMSPAQQVASTTEAYAEGHADRVAWENWFNAQSGSARSGAEYWSGVRSTVHPAPCTAVNRDPAFVAGCQAAQQRLAAVDVRRKTEANYWWGWNSV